jgi:hypothetical protein
MDVALEIVPATAPVSHQKSGRRRRSRAGFAHAFGTEPCIHGGCCDVANLDIRHLDRHRHQIIRQRAIRELTVFAVDAFLEKCRAQPLNQASAYLLIRQHRIDDPAAVLDDPVFQDLGKSGLDIELDVRSLKPIGERERIALRRTMMCDR